MVVLVVVTIGGSGASDNESSPHDAPITGTTTSVPATAAIPIRFTAHKRRWILAGPTRSHSLARMPIQPYPGAVAPERQHHVDCGGLAIAVHEWGDASAPPLFLVHGGMDFARTFEVFAPMLASAGWRVVSWDHRGHGDSEYAEIYSWDADIRDATQIMDHITSEPAPVVAHSKGGGMTIQLADAQPYRFSHVVNIDGLPGKNRLPDVSEHERTKMMATDIAGWLDHRRATALRSRRPGTIEELAKRRGTMNPRLSLEWLCHLVTVG